LGPYSRFTRLNRLWQSLPRVEPLPVKNIDG